MKKIIRRALSLGLTALTTTTFACGQAQSDNKTDTSAAVTSAEPEATTIDSLPEDLDFGGRTVTWFVRGDPPSPEYYVEEQTGDIVDDAIFNRNQQVCERLNVNFDFFEIPGAWANRDSFNQTIQSSILAGDGAYDILAGYSMCIASISASGLLQDLASTEYLDFDQPWWSDSLIEMSQGVYSDLDGDGKKSTGDRFGTVLPYIYIDAFYFSSGLNTTDIVKGVPQISADYSGERVQNLLEYLCGQMHDTDDNYLAPDTIDERNTFMHGNTLFGIHNLNFAKGNLRDVNFDYGILPMPKYDEAQSEYCTITGFPYSLYSIPLDAPDADMSSAVLEAMASASYREVSPALFEVAMKVKYTTDDDSARMYDLIRETIMFDFGRVFTDNLDSLTYGLFRNAVRDNSTSWMSVYESNKARLESMLGDVISSFK